METANDLIATSDVLAGIERLLGMVDHSGRGLSVDAERLELLRVAVRIAGRCTALAEILAAEVEATEAAERAHGTDPGSWLAETTRLTRKEAAALLFAGRDLSRFRAVASATLAGRVLPQQARAMTRVLADLPEHLPEPVVAEGEELLVGYADQFNSAEVARLSRHLLDVLAPEVAEANEAERLEREYQLAVRNRHLEFHHDGLGTSTLRGSLPTVDAEGLIRLVEAHAAQQKRALEAIDPLQPLATRAQHRMDGLMAMVHQHSQQALAPSHGGDRPRIVVTIDYGSLHKRCVDAHLLGAGEAIAASALRRLACDADLLPMVLNGPSEPLDVGRTQRLSPARFAQPSRPATAAVPSRVATDRPATATPTTSSRGRPAELRRFGTSFSCARITTTSSSPATIRPRSGGRSGSAPTALPRSCPRPTSTAPEDPARTPDT